MRFFRCFFLPQVYAICVYPNSNLFVVSDWQKYRFTLQYLDLSIAREISSDQQDTRSLGTVGYAAPEQYGVAQSNRATDLYALGVLLNIMITGVHPAVDIPRGPIRHIVQKATDTQISKRYKSAAAMARALRPYVRL